MKIAMYNALGVLIAFLLALTTVHFWTEVTLLSNTQILHVIITYALLNLMTYILKYAIAELVSREKSKQKFKFIKPSGDSNERD